MGNFRTLSLDEVCKKILDAKNPIMAIHRSPDGDAVGSAAGLSAIFDALGMHAEYICADKIPERLEFLSHGIKLSNRTDFSGCDVICLDIASPSQLGKLPEIAPEVLSPYLMIDHHAIGEVSRKNDRTRLSEGTKKRNGRAVIRGDFFRRRLL